MTADRAMIRTASAELPTGPGVFRIMGFESVASSAMDAPGQTSSGLRGDDMLALVAGDLGGSCPLVFVHDPCLLCEVFRASHCDSARRMAMAMQMIAESSNGVVFYLHNESIPLAAELLTLHGPGGEGRWARCARGAVAVLESLGVESIALLGTKGEAAYFERAGIRVKDCLPFPEQRGNL